MRTPDVFRVPWSYPGHGRVTSWSPFDDHRAPVGLRWLGRWDPAEHWDGEVPRALAAVFDAGPRPAYALFTFDDDLDAEIERCALAFQAAEDGDRPGARKELRRHPMTMHARWTLGLVEDLWSSSRAATSMGDVVREAETSVREGFDGVLPWSERSNRPFLLALRWFADREDGRALHDRDRAWIRDSLRWLDPCGPSADGDVLAAP